MALDSVKVQVVLKHLYRVVVVPARFLYIYTTHAHIH